MKEQSQKGKEAGGSKKGACGLASIVSGKAHRDVCTKCRLEYHYIKSISGAKKTLSRFMRIEPKQIEKDPNEVPELPEELKAKQRKVIGWTLAIVVVLLLGFTFRPNATSSQQAPVANKQQ